MKLNEIAGTGLQYSDFVKMADAKSKYYGKFGKIVQITNTAAKVLFKDEKKPVSVMLTGLERI